MNNVDVLAYPLRLVPCRACNRDYPRPPGRPERAPTPHCARCGGSRYVYAPEPGARGVHLRTVEAHEHP